MSKIVVILSEIDWDYLWQRHQIFATQYAKNGCRVYYINRLGMRYPKISELGYVFKRLISYFGRSKISEAKSTTNDVKIVSPIFLPGDSYIERLINKLIFVPLFKKKINFDGEIIFHVYQPTATTLDILDGIKDKKVLYDCVQNFQDHPSKTGKTELYEKRLITESNVMITDSEYLYNKNLRFKPELIRIPPGVDFEHFSQTYRGDELKKLKNILYYGHVRGDLDFDLINNIANSPQYSLTIVGTIADTIKNKLSTNIKIIGKKSYEELPMFIKEADILLLPYAINNFTQAIIPAKFYECLATGKPIIATGLQDVYQYKDYINIVDNQNSIDFIFDNMSQFENLDKKIFRQKIGSENSWKGRFEKFYSAL